ncbi:MAG: hypothetical protein IJH20_04980 [Bacilli bacterium]|nr:hypothetical protein [Bacilli bacterium]
MKLIKKIYNFFDKKVIVPITRLITLIGDKIKKLNKPLEVLLRKKSSTIVIALIVAAIIFVLVDRSNLTMENNAEVLYNQPVNAVYNTEEYVIEGLPKTVDITMIGSRANLYLAKQLSNQVVTVDLSDLGVGTHQVNLKYKQAVSSVQYKLDPSTVSITIFNKQSLSKDITNEYVNMEKLNSKFSIKDVKLVTVKEEKKIVDGKEETVEKNEELTSVIVKGKEDTIKKVAIVKALINMDQLSGSSAKDGDNTIVDVPLVAYDSDGEKMDIEIVPSKVRAVVNLESSSKEVPINVVVNDIDNIEFGKAISSIDTSIDKVTLYGSSEVLENINKIDVAIDIPADMKSSKKYTIAIKKPNGVRDLSTKTITVDVELGESAQTKVSGVKISYRNLNSSFLVQATQDSTTEIPVIVKGVEDVISDISAQDIEAYVDLKDITAEGEVTVKVNTTGKDNRATYEPSINEIKLLIIKK